MEKWTVIYRDYMNCDVKESSWSLSRPFPACQSPCLPEQTVWAAHHLPVWSAYSTSDQWQLSSTHIRGGWSLPSPPSHRSYNHSEDTAYMPAADRRAAWLASISIHYWCKHCALQDTPLKRGSHTQQSTLPLYLMLTWLGQNRLKTNTILQTTSKGIDCESHWSIASCNLLW